MLDVTVDIRKLLVLILMIMLIWSHVCTDLGHICNISLVE